MKFRIIKTLKYRDCRVYLRNIGDAFEYLAVINKQVYAAHVIIKKKFFQREYTKLQLEKATNIIEKMAEATIDSVLDRK
jgi:hypothetical protein